MIPTDSDSKAENRFKWLPTAAQHYHLHKEQGAPIRTIARNLGCHASTVSRQVKRIERMRDDPAVRATLDKLRQVQSLQGPQLQSKPDAEPEEKRILRLLQTKGAVLVLAENMQKALIVTEEQAQSAIPIGTVSAEVAQALAMQGTLKCVSKGKLSRFILASSAVATSGRNRLSEHAAEYIATVNTAAADKPKSSSAGPQETPLAILARRRDKSGKAFCPVNLLPPVNDCAKISKLADLCPVIMAHGISAFWMLRQRRHCPKILGNAKRLRMSPQRCVNWGPVWAMWL